MNPRLAWGTCTTFHTRPPSSWFIPLLSGIQTGNEGLLSICLLSTVVSCQTLHVPTVLVCGLQMHHPTHCLPPSRGTETQHSSLILFLKMPYRPLIHPSWTLARQTIDFRWKAGGRSNLPQSGSTAGHTYPRLWVEHPGHNWTLRDFTVSLREQLLKRLHCLWLKPVLVWPVLWADGVCTAASCAQSQARCSFPPLAALWTKSHAVRRHDAIPTSPHGLRTRARTCLLSAFKTSEMVLWSNTRAVPMHLCTPTSGNVSRTDPSSIDYAWASRRLAPRLDRTTFWAFNERITGAEIHFHQCAVIFIFSRLWGRRRGIERKPRTAAPANNDAPALISKPNKPVFSSGHIPAPITSQLIGLMRQTRCPRCIFNDLLIWSFVFSYEFLCHF